MNPTALFGPEVTLFLDFIVITCFGYGDLLPFDDPVQMRCANLTRLIPPERLSTNSGSMFGNIELCWLQRLSLCVRVHRSIG